MATQTGRAPTPTKGRAAAPRKKEGEKEGGGDEERVNVVVRIRPQVSADEGGADNVSLQVDRARDMVWALGADDGGEGREGSFKSAGGGGGSFSKASAKAPKQFVFDRVIPPDGSQQDVYDAAAASIVKSTLEGFTGCVMCYGQTGAGKTYTLANERSGAGAGVMIRAFEEIFDQIRADAEHEYSVEMAYLQVYLEALYDLLEPSAEVQIREDTKTGVFLTGLTWRPVGSVDDAKAVLADGNGNRATASTSMNADSSRSHAVMMLQLTRRGGTRTLMGKLYMVDLAGSERIKKSGVEGQGLEEAISINKSLTTLGRCIEAMAKNSKTERPPFRESKLTRLLSNALGGNAKTTLIVCVAPSKRDTFETHNSLEFGQQAMNVVVRARVNATLDYGGLSANLQAQLDGKQGALHALEARVLQELAAPHEAVLELERAAKAHIVEAKQAQAAAARAKDELKSALAAEAAAQREAEARKNALLVERQAKTSALAKAMAALDDTPELRRVRAAQEEEKATLARELESTQAELARVHGSTVPEGGGGALDAEKELLTGVAKNLGNLALHFVRQDARADAEPLVVSAQAIFESVLGADHPHIAEWKGQMFERIAGTQQPARPPQPRQPGAEGGGGGVARGALHDAAREPGAGAGAGDAAPLPVSSFLDMLVNPAAAPGGDAGTAERTAEFVGSFRAPRGPVRTQRAPGGVDVSLNLAKVSRGGGATSAERDARRVARAALLDAAREPLHPGDAAGEGHAAEAVRAFFADAGNGPDAILECHRLVSSARLGGSARAEALGSGEHSASFAAALGQLFRARGDERTVEAGPTPPSAGRARDGDGNGASGARVRPGPTRSRPGRAPHPVAT